MELYQTLEFVNKPVSRLVFGCANELINGGTAVDDVMDAAFAAGINTFDTAENYGKSECVLGSWIARRGLRDRVVIISKGCHPYGRSRVAPEDLQSDIEKSFVQLQTDYIDVYLLHRDDTNVPVGPLVETLNAYHKAGKIGAFGGSNWTHQRIREANDYATAHNLVPFTISSPNYGLANQLGDPWGGNCVTISGPQNEEARAFYRETGMPVLAYSSLGHGLFSGKVKGDDMEGAKAILDGGGIRGYWFEENFERLRRAECLAKELGSTVPQVALAWIFHQNLNVLGVVSVSSAGRIASNMAALQLPLTDAQCRWLNLELDSL